MQIKTFIGTNKIDVEVRVNSFVKQANTITVLSIRHDMSFALSPTDKKQFRTTITYVKKGK